MMTQFEQQFLAFAKQEMTEDQAHDINHVMRVVKSAKALCEGEQANLQVVLPAAYLHDCFSFPKNHPDRAQSSVRAAEKALEFLTLIDYPNEYFEQIHHAIVAHSFSAKVTPRTLEAQIVQDADRLDSLGAIGIARCLQVSCALGVDLYCQDDPFCTQRAVDDRQYTIDHFYAKLLKIGTTMNTPSATREAQRRTTFMRDYLDQLALEI